MVAPAGRDQHEGMTNTTDPSRHRRSAHRRSLLGLAAVAGAALVLPACGGLVPERGSGVPETASFEFAETGDLTGVSVSNAFEAEVRVADGPATVEVTVDDNLIDDLEVELRGGTVHIGFDSGRYRTDVIPTAVISVPVLLDVEASGASTVDVESELDSASVTIDASGASSITAEVTAGLVRIDASGASLITLGGQADETVIDASGASRVRLDDLDAGQADLSASGASQIHVGAATEIDVDASGASRIVAPDGTLDAVELSGGARVDRD